MHTPLLSCMRCRLHCVMHPIHMLHLRSCVPQPAVQARLAAHRTAWERAALGRLRKVAEIQGELAWWWVCGKGGGAVGP